MTTETLEEPTANPYNSKKEWHTPIESSNESADGMYFERPTKQATRQETAPEEESTQKRTNYKKRYDDLKKHYDEKISSFKQKEQELQALARAQVPEYAPPKSAEELEQFRTEHPDLYETVESVAHMQSQQQVQGLQAKLSAIEEREARISRREAETALHDKHPDFEDIRGDAKFHKWAEDQPEAIQDWIYNNPNNVGLAIKAIDLYKMENGISKTKKSRQSPKSNNAADFVSTKTKNIDSGEAKIWTQREIAAMSVQQFDKHEAEIDQAIAEGRVR